MVSTCTVLCHHSTTARRPFTRLGDMGEPSKEEACNVEVRVCMYVQYSCVCVFYIFGASHAHVHSQSAGRSPDLPAAPGHVATRGRRGAAPETVGWGSGVAQVLEGSGRPLLAFGRARPLQLLQRPSVFYF